MHIGELPQRTQEYLKLLWGISERAGESGGQASVSLSELSRRAQQKNSTTSEAIKRLQSRGLVEHEPYSGVRLTELGARLAVTMIRRHRLIETFLVETLGYTWDEIHADADLLEHAATDRFIDRIDELLNFPTRDPHGDPIPSADGRVEDLGVMSLAECTPGLPVIIEQVNDEDPELLRYLAAHGIAPGSKVCVTSPSVAGLVHVQVLTPIVEEPIGDPVALAIKAAADVKISVADDSLADDHGAGDNPVTTR
ncbi:metal-dependent transcriptional regulator [Corynebacterium propinquum]|uniref:Diphtheria toxin repressor n=1 Tax=Corynebacterium propinquum TaxID=43769 RepID=A0AAP4F8I6_9CORY|nr:metal-dependent transcriptional regulator [Corynebacterium propinquum]MCG7232677.1 metal-dependent transcriptional regulator [Corynebacterium propinquum]MDK4292874.1 metal-dependent transcriptional regulator [Corynebacterium propinquum]MDK4326754.1 metal-dependent transcriptional regulator [Corynebacterium propinquum]MDK8536327.1 metal-dependent transcriptional regulator [Corynebacterium propinquum]MDK8666365.1 metal-dependent transcriptional regulator [Corynebacterium propinquum]